MATSRRELSGIKNLLSILHILHESLEYDAITGQFTWKVRPLEHFLDETGWAEFNTRYAGQRAGGRVRKCSSDIYEHISIRVRGVLYRFKAHHVAWAMSGREFVKGKELDHKNKCRTDNSLGNLRLATRSQNNVNSGPRRNCKSGIKGVKIVKDRFAVRITVDGKSKHIGVYDTVEEAVAARDKAYTEEYGEFFDPTAKTAEHWYITPEDEKWINSIGSL